MGILALVDLLLNQQEGENMPLPNRDIGLGKRYKPNILARTFFAS